MVDTTAAVNSLRNIRHFMKPQRLSAINWLNLLQCFNRGNFHEDFRSNMCSEELFLSVEPNVFGLIFQGSSGLRHSEIYCNHADV